jgi:phosphatidylglycerophosphatase A
VIAFLAVPLFFVGVWACGVAGRNLGVQDHGAFVWDEIVAFLPLAALVSGSLFLQALAFALFRLFDIWKPFPIRQFEARVKGGFGVMLDDLLAACYAYLALVVVIIAIHRLHLSP